MASSLLDNVITNKKNWAPAMMEETSPYPRSPLHLVEIDKTQEPHNAWFPTGKFLGRELTYEQQDILSAIAELGLGAGPAKKIAQTGTSAINKLISKNTKNIGKNISDLSKPTIPVGDINKVVKDPNGGLLDELVKKIKARNRESAKKIAKVTTGKEMQESRMMTIEELEKIRKQSKDWSPARERAYWDHIKRIGQEEMGYTIDEALDIAKIQPWRPMTINRAIRHVNRMPISAPGTASQKGGANILHYGPKMMRPQYNTPSRGVLEEYYRKMGAIGPDDIDFKQIPTFMRNRMGKWDK